MEIIRSKADCQVTCGGESDRTSRVVPLILMSSKVDD